MVYNNWYFDDYKRYFTVYFAFSFYPIDYRYVWEHLEVGYVQGMCDLVAPLLVIFDDGKDSSQTFVAIFLPC